MRLGRPSFCSRLIPKTAYTSPICRFLADVAIEDQHEAPTYDLKPSWADPLREVDRQCFDDGRGIYLTFISAQAALRPVSPETGSSLDDASLSISFPYHFPALPSSRGACEKKACATLFQQDPCYSRIKTENLLRLMTAYPGCAKL
jgi:hypothetical protein